MSAVANAANAHYHCPMSTPTTAPYGSWKSPITADLLLSGSVNLSQPCADGDDIYWLEGRPLERGRQVVVRRAPDGTTEDVTPPGFSARTRVHEYGGGDYTVHDGVVYFANDADQRLYRQRPGAAPRPITPEENQRYADLHVDAARGRLLAVREDHRGPGEAVNTLVAIDLDDGATTVLAEGYDFYSSPRLSPDGQQLAWLGWNHPNMPWDGTELWLADLAADGRPRHARRVAGGPAECATIGQGGTIPLMNMLSQGFPSAQMMVCGVLGPRSNAHGPNEFLHVPYAKRLTAAVAEVIARMP